MLKIDVLVFLYTITIAYRVLIPGIYGVLLLVVWTKTDILMICCVIANKKNRRNMFNDIPQKKLVLGIWLV